MYQTALAYSEQCRDDRIHDRMAPNNADRGDYDSADNSAMVLVHASAYDHNTRGSALDIYQILYSQATSGSRGSLERTYRNYTC